jgi:hypothetical protein
MSRVAELAVPAANRSMNANINNLNLITIGNLHGCSQSATNMSCCTILMNGFQSGCIYS